MPVRAVDGIRLTLMNMEHQLRPLTEKGLGCQAPLPCKWTSSAFCRVTLAFTAFTLHFGQILQLQGNA